jgi:predicted alpha/beta-hydrolase family hydrolase
LWHTARVGQTVRVDEHKIELEPGVAVSSVWAFPEGFTAGKSPALILAHGAGTDMRNPLLSFVHEALAQRGVVTVKFNFPYMEAGRKAPDPPQRLAHAWRTVLQRVRADANPGALFLGGKSMGGRIASLVVAGGEPAAGLVLLGYPLQPAGRPETLRSEHFARIACPVLFIQGSRDRLCDLNLLRGAMATMSAPVTLHVIEAGDHSFKVPQRSGKTERQVWDEIVGVVAAWLATAVLAKGASLPTGRAAC